MRISVLKLMLAVICVPAVIVLGAGRAAAPALCLPTLLHLHTFGGNLLLELTPPGAGTAKFVDSPALSRSGGNP